MCCTFLFSECIHDPGHTLSVTGSRVIFHELGMAPSLQDSDLYEGVCQFPIAYRAGEDPAVCEEMSLQTAAALDPIEDPSDESEGEDDSNVEGVADDNPSQPQNKRKKKLSVPDKVCFLPNHPLSPAYG